MGWDGVQKTGHFFVEVINVSLREHYICYWLVKYLCACTFGTNIIKGLVLYSFQYFWADFGEISKATKQLFDKEISYTAKNYEVQKWFW